MWGSVARFEDNDERVRSLAMVRRTEKMHSKFQVHRQAVGVLQTALTGTEPPRVHSRPPVVAHRDPPPLLPPPLLPQVLSVPSCPQEQVRSKLLMLQGTSCASLTDRGSARRRRDTSRPPCPPAPTDVSLVPHVPALPCHATGPGTLVLQCGPMPMMKVMSEHLTTLNYTEEMMFQF